MEYQKITNFLDNASNQFSKFKTKNSVEINDELKLLISTATQVIGIW